MYIEHVVVWFFSCSFKVSPGFSVILCFLLNSKCCIKVSWNVLYCIIMELCWFCWIFCVHYCHPSHLCRAVTLLKIWSSSCPECQPMGLTSQDGTSHNPRSDWDDFQILTSKYGTLYFFHIRSKYEASKDYLHGLQKITNLISPKNHKYEWLSGWRIRCECATLAADFLAIWTLLWCMTQGSYRARFLCLYSWRLASKLQAHASCNLARDSPQQKCIKARLTARKLSRFNWLSRQAMPVIHLSWMNLQCMATRYDSWYFKPFSP